MHLKRVCIEFKYYADGIQSGLTPPGNNRRPAGLTKAELSPSVCTITTSQCIRAAEDRSRWKQLISQAMVADCELQLFHDAIVKACVESGKQCIAHTSKSGKTSALTGWNEFVKPYRDDSIFWHNIWRQCGSPRNAVVADVMRRARKEYHNAVRALRLDQHQLHRQKVSQALLNNKNSDFWKEIRKAKGNCDALPSVIDCMSKE